MLTLSQLLQQFHERFETVGCRRRSRFLSAAHWTPLQRCISSMGSLGVVQRNSGLAVASGRILTSSPQSRSGRYFCYRKLLFHL